MLICGLAAMPAREHSLFIIMNRITLNALLLSGNQRINFSSQSGNLTKENFFEAFPETDALHFVCSANEYREARRHPPVSLPAKRQFFQRFLC